MEYEKGEERIAVTLRYDKMIQPPVPIFCFNNSLTKIHSQEIMH